jgi:hypothetical protein
MGREMDGWMGACTHERAARYGGSMLVCYVVGSKGCFLIGVELSNFFSFFFLFTV